MKIMDTVLNRPNSLNNVFSVFIFLLRQLKKKKTTQPTKKKKKQQKKKHKPKNQPKKT